LELTKTSNILEDPGFSDQIKKGRTVVNIIEDRENGEYVEMTNVDKKTWKIQSMKAFEEDIRHQFLDETDYVSWTIMQNNKNNDYIFALTYFDKERNTHVRLECREYTNNHFSIYPFEIVIGIGEMLYLSLKGKSPHIIMNVFKKQVKQILETIPKYRLKALLGEIAFF
jgi:hypothetical protein